jgi:DNA polymerase III subunit chi
MAEIYFYHLEHQSLEEVLPQLLERCLARGWRAVVQLGHDERLEALSTHLWTYRDEAFLPHGSAQDGHAARQPIWLTTGEDNPNGAQVRFFLDGTRPAGFDGYERVVLLFDGAAESEVEQARALWKEAKAQGHEVSYWRQDERGRWQNIAKAAAG